MVAKKGICVETLKTLYFQFGEEDFSVSFNVHVTGTEITSAPQSTLTFLSFLKKLKLIDPHQDSIEWLNSCDEFNQIDSFSSLNSSKSLMVRKKACLLGLELIPGEYFNKRKQEGTKGIL